MQRYFNPRLNFKLAQYKTEQFYIPDVRAHCGNISDKKRPVRQARQADAE